MKWTEIKIITTLEASEAVVGMMYDIEDIGGLYIQDPRDMIKPEQDPTSWDYIDEILNNIDPNHVIIRGYLSEHVNVNEKIVLLQEKLNNLKNYFDIDEAKIECSEVFEKDWANNWKKYYKPVQIGKYIVIKPTWEEYEPYRNDELIIEMDPGMAFGTGTHETTKMCIQLLEKYVESDKDILDIGCGTGILGIAGLKLGARSSLGVDIDSNAVRITDENARINNVEDKLIVRQGNLLDIITDKYDIIIANIIADAIISLSSDIYPYLRKNGVFISSGIIRDRYEEVRSKLLDNGFLISDELFMGEWVALAAKVRE